MRYHLLTGGGRSLLVLTMKNQVIDAAYLYRAAARCLLLAASQGGAMSKRDLKVALDLATLAVSMDEERPKLWRSTKRRR